MAGSETTAPEKSLSAPPLPARPGFWRLTGALLAGAWRRVARDRVRLGLGLLASIPVFLLAHRLDHPCMAWLASWRTEDIRHAAVAISSLGELHFAPLAIVLALWAWAELTRRPRLRLPIGACVLAACLSGVLAQVLKFVFGRPRPNLKVPDQLSWFHPSWDSFPSGHTTHWCALVAALWFVSPRLALWLSPPALAVMAARLLVPRHYPTDILGGCLLGVACGIYLGLAARDLSARRETSARS